MIVAVSVLTLANLVEVPGHQEFSLAANNVSALIW